MSKKRTTIRAWTVQGLVLALLLSAMARAAAQPAAARASLGCQPEEGVTVVTVEGLTTTLPQPLPSSGLDHAGARTRFVLDLGEVPPGTTATVTATMSWTIEANDWDLTMEDAAGAVLGRSWDLQPFHPPVEQVSGHERPHCAVFTLVSLNCCPAVPTPEVVDSLDTVISVTDVGSSPAISFDDCRMTLHVFRDSAARVSAWIPDPTRYTTVGTVAGRPDQAFLAFWFYSCGGMAIDGEGARPTNLSLVSVVVKRVGAVPRYDPLGDVPVDFDHYLLWAHTDNNQLAKRLEDVGMPVERVRSIDFERPNEFDAFSSVVSSQGSYSASMSGHNDDFEHWHGNTFWHDDTSLGESQLQILIASADDWSCNGFAYFPLPTVPPCGRVSAEPGSAVERLLGAPTRDSFEAFNHVEFDATASLTSHG